MKKWLEDLWLPVLNNLPTDLDSAVVAIINNYFDTNFRDKDEDDEFFESTKSLLEKLFSEFNQNTYLYDLSQINDGDDMRSFYDHFLFKVKEKTILSNKQEIHNLFDNIVKNQGYTFTDDDFSTIQKLLNELRDKISKAPMINEGHKKRLLSKLEKLQQELHKTISDFDQFFGMCCDLALLARQFGEAVQPITDCAKELCNLISYAHSCMMGLPQLPMPADKPWFLPSTKDIEAK